ncbi:MAG: hypothetical protein LQ349_004358 [Xanthoria aureola]|nr:MAG: hypothetical protein LQ349_004358 [Xanthoria aureola]
MSSDECSTASPSSLDSHSSTISSTTSTKDLELIKEEIGNYLEAIGDGFFATSGVIPIAMNPGLSLKGLGRVGLPLSERDANDIAKISREAPFGKGTKKLVDKSVRNTWEIDPTQVEFRNPQWQKTLQYAVSKTVEQLGVLGGQSSVRADLHKLLLYEEGGFFKTHRDTEKAPGMFATLVIMLPSAHEGGEVVVRLGKERRTLSNPESNEFNYAFLAWYADVNHSIQPVTSGYRLVLTYNLIHHSGDLGKARPPSVLEDRNSLIDSAFMSWKKLLDDDDEGSEELVYLFDHQYSEANFGLDFLKGEDQVRGLHLHDACKKHGFNLFLAHFEHSERSKDEGDDDDDEDEWTLTKLFTPDGVCIGESTEIEKEAIIQDNPFEGDSPDHEESEGWLGNEDATCTEFYRRSCLVIVPEQNFNSFLNRASSLNTNDWTNALLHRMDDSTQADAARRELFKVCSLTSSKGVSTSSGCDSLLNVALKLDMPSLLIFAMEKSPLRLSVEALRDLARGMGSRDVSPWLQIYVPGVPFSNSRSISTTISAIPRLGTRLGAIEIFNDEYGKAVALNESPDMTPEKRKYKSAEVARCLSEALVRKPPDGDLQLGEDDNRYLLSKARSQGDDFVLEVVLPICKLVVKNIDFVADTISQLSETKKGRTSRSNVLVFARDIITLLAQEMSDHCASKSGKESRIHDFQPPKYSLHTSYYSHLYKTSMSWKAITKIFCLCEMLDIVDRVPLLTRPLIQIAHASGMNDLTHFLVPLIKSLASELPKLSNSLPHYQDLFQQVLHHYIKDQVGEKPSPPQNLVRGGNKEKCYISGGLYSTSTERYECKDCKALNDFLAAPDRSEWRYKAAEPGRKHLGRQLYGLDCNSFTDKSQGTPHTLVIRKTDKSYRDALQQWERRCAGAWSDFEGIGEGKLELFLGEEYDSIMEQLYRVTNRPTQGSGRQPLGPLAASAQNNKRPRDGIDDAPTEKRARHVEIIDLC